MITFVLTKKSDLSALDAWFIIWFKHNIDVCLKLRLAMSMIVNIYVVKYFVLHMVLVGDVKVNLKDAKFIFETSYNHNLKNFCVTNVYNIYPNIHPKKNKWKSFHLFFFFWLSELFPSNPIRIYSQKKDQIQYLRDHELHTNLDFLLAIILYNSDYHKISNHHKLQWYGLKKTYCSWWYKETYFQNNHMIDKYLSKISISFCCEHNHSFFSSSL